MSFFIGVITQNLTYVFFLLFVVIELYLINSGGRVGRIPFVFMLLCLFLLPGIIRRLEIIIESLSFGFVPAIIFHCSLSLDFVCGGMCWLASLGNLLIGLLYMETWL